jgi:hypothetical protein
MSFRIVFTKSLVMRVDEDEFLPSISVLCVVAMSFCDGFTNCPEKPRMPCDVRWEQENDYHGTSGIAIEI